METPCLHPVVECLNQFELIRKYRCTVCSGVMMCCCDQSFAETFLSHQLDHGTILNTQERVPVTHAFQDRICRECRGLAPEAHPTAEIYGRTSKVKRYYWREIFFETTRRFATWANVDGNDYPAARQAQSEQYKEFEREVTTEMRLAHEKSPKYAYREISDKDVLSKYGVDILQLDAKYTTDQAQDRVLISSHGVFDGPEALSGAHFRRLGFSVLEAESRPFHVLFGVYMWLLVQHPSDELCRMVAFGERVAFETGAASKQIWTTLPDDFGTSGYGQRRRNAIDEHFQLLEDDLQWLFDY